MSGLWFAGMAALATMSGARAEPAAQALFAAAWQRAECNQPLLQAVNNARFHELGGGYALGVALCWLGPRAETHILFVIAPRTGGKPQLLRLQQWVGKSFEPADALPMVEYNETSRTLTSFRAYSGSGICGAAGEWTWTGSEFRMTGYWEKPDCSDDSEFDRSDRFRIFPRKP